MVPHVVRAFLALGLVTLCVDVAQVHAQTFFLSTPYNSNNGQRGVMFDVTATNSVIIRRFDANLYAGTTANYEIYTKTGTHVGFENNAAAWTFVCAMTDITSAGNNLPTPLPCVVDAPIAVGERRAFYITNDFGAGTSYTDGTAVGNFLASDANLIVYEGVGKSYPFGLTFPVRNPNVTIYYDLGATTSSSRVIDGDAGWRMLSAPVTGFTVDQISDDTAIQGIAGGADEAEAANFFIRPSTGAWTEPTDVSTAWGDGLGFITYFFNNTNSGSSTLPVTLGVNGSERVTDVSVATQATGFTLLGNPYVTGFDLDQLTGNGSGGVSGGLVSPVQVWSDGAGDPVAGTACDAANSAGCGSFVTVNFGASQAEIIAPWQGMLVESLNATSATLPLSGRTNGAPTVAEFSVRQPRPAFEHEGFLPWLAADANAATTLTTDDAAEASGQDQAYHSAALEEHQRSQRNDTPAYREVGFELSGPAGSYDRSPKLFFHATAHAGRDGYDGTKLTPLQSAYTTLGFVQRNADGSERLLVQDSRAFDPTEVQHYDIAFTSAGLDGTFTLRWPEWTHIPEDWLLRLRDLQTGETVDLRASEQYTFEAGATTSATRISASKLGAGPTLRPASATDAEVRFRLEVVPGLVAATAATDELPSRIALLQNYPNPFNPVTRIGYALPSPGVVRLVVYDVLGREVAVLADGLQQAGRYEVTWDATGRPSGTYVYRLETASHSTTRTMLLLK